MRILKVALAASALALTTQAEAAKYLLTYSGQIITNDALGIYGAASFSASAPRAYTADFTIDDSVPDASFDETASNTSGYNFGARSAVITGVLTVDNRSYSFGGSEAQFATGNFGGRDTINVLTGFEDDLTYAALQFDAAYFGAPANFRTAFAASAPVGLEYLSAGSFTVTDYRTNISSTGNATIESVSLAAIPGAVPEPATWAMMMLGFGMVGGAARYHRRRMNVTFA